MRILYIPQISNKLLNASSSYNFFSVFNKTILKKYPDTVFYLVKPQIIGSKFNESEVLEFPNTIVVPVEAYENQIDDVLLVSKNFYNLFNERRTDFYFDVIFNEKVANTSLIKQISMFSVHGKSVNPVIVNRDQFIISKDAPNTQYGAIDEIYELNEALGWMTAPTIFQSVHQKNKARNIVKKYFRPQYVERFDKHSYVFPLGIDCQNIDNMFDSIKKNDVFTVTFSSKLYDFVRYKDSLEVLDTIYKTSKSKIDVQIVTASGESSFMRPGVSQYKYIRHFCKAGRETFINESSKAHVFISNAPRQDFSMTMVEQMYMGLIPVLPNVVRSKYLLPEGYPYLFNSKQEQIATIKYIAENYESVYNERVPKIREKIKRDFDLEHISLSIYDMFEQLVNERNEKTKVSGNILQLIKDAVGILPDKFSSEDFFDAIRKCSSILDVEKDLENKSSVTKLFVINVMIHYCDVKLLPNLYYLEFEKVKKSKK